MRNCREKTKAEALRAAARALREAETEVLAANARDLAAGEASGLTGAMLDRLKLDPARLSAIADAVAQIAGLADPVGETIDSSERPNGLRLSRVRVPIGLIGIIYESRPNVTADAAALCLRSGNAVLLRGGSEAVNSNRAIHAALVRGFETAGVPADAVQLVPTQDRAVVGAMLTAAGLIDMIVPRGGKSLVARVQADARVPVLAHLDGICHTYIHSAADPAMAKAVALNAKMRRTGICGATETLLIDAQFPGSAEVLAALLDSGCELRGDARARAIDSRIVPASANDWDTEYLDAVLAVAVVDGLDQALAHIDRHSSNHTDAIVTGGSRRGRTLPRRSRQRHRHGQRLDPVRRWRRIRAWRRNRHRHRPAACPWPGRAGRADDLQVASARDGPNSPLMETRP